MQLLDAAQDMDIENYRQRFLRLVNDGELAPDAMLVIPAAVWLVLLDSVIENRDELETQMDIIAPDVRSGKQTRERVTALEKRVQALEASRVVGGP